jgi:uncharacterized protein (DUF1501 family)
VLEPTDGVGLHPNPKKFKGLYDSGRLAVIQGVGYPNPNRSHFAAWTSGTRRGPARALGLARPLHLGLPVWAGQRTARVSVGDQLNTMFWTDTTPVPAVASIGAFSFLTDTRYKNDRTWQMQTLQNIYSQAAASAVREPDRAAPSRRWRRRRAAESGGRCDTRQAPGQQRPGQSVKLVGQVIAATSAPAVRSHGRLRYHANQKETHARLLTT